MKITKRPKMVRVEYEEVVSYISRYYCPSCFTTFTGCGPRTNVTSFVCSCGQKLIVENKKGAK